MKVKKPENSLSLLLEKLAVNNLKNQEEILRLKEEFENQETRILTNAKLISE